MLRLHRSCSWVSSVLSSLPTFQSNRAKRFDLVIGGRRQLLLGGELRNSSAATPEQIVRQLQALRALNANVALLPATWELLEPREGEYDFSLLDCMVEESRRNKLMLIPLWFGTMKNATSCYVPSWVKTDLDRFPRAQEKPGQSSWTVSVFCEEAVRCDARAYGRLMTRIRELDPDGTTVPVVQVENEPGMLNARRDLSPVAQKAFDQPVPEQLTRFLADRPAGELRPELEQAWARPGRLRAGTWTDVFGTMADEVFMAWHVARFVERVAAAGKAIHPIPTFANAWLINGPGYEPGMYPSGGPVPGVLDVWRCAAPSVDAIAPDIYAAEFRGYCSDYDRPSNPLLIPETRNNLTAAARALYAVGRHGAVLFSPFAIDDVQADDPIARTYALLHHMQPALSDAVADGRTTAFLQQSQEDSAWEAELGGYRFRARTRKPIDEKTVPGALLLVQVADHEFVIVGQNLIVTFTPVSVALRTAEIVWCDAGGFENGKWVGARRINGDESAHGTGVLLGDTISAVRFVLHAYA
jgi:hypothetical protein